MKNLTLVAICFTMSSFILSAFGTFPAVADDLNLRFLKAVETGCLEEVKRLLDEGVDLQALDRTGQSALVRAAGGRRRVNGGACKSRRLETMKLLLERGADVNAKDGCGRTALIITSRLADHANEVELLLKHGADLNAESKYGRTALIEASSWNVKSLELLLQYGAEVNAKNRRGETALLEASCRTNNYETIKLLLDNGADINATTNDGVTAIHFAAYMNLAENVQVLVDNGADIFVKDGHGASPLMVSCIKGSYGAAKVLLVTMFNKRPLGTALTTLLTVCIILLPFVLEALVGALLLRAHGLPFRRMLMLWLAALVLFWILVGLGVTLVWHAQGKDVLNMGFDKACLVLAVATILILFRLALFRAVLDRKQAKSVSAPKLSFLWGLGYYAAGFITPLGLMMIFRTFVPPV